MPEPSRVLPRVDRCSVVVALLVLGLWSAPALVAQGTGATSGTTLWWGVTVGAGGTRLTCDICQPRRDVGPSADLLVGAHASQNVRVGVEAGTWAHDDDGERENVYRLGVVAQLAPVADKGLYLLGGFGWSGYRAGDFSYDAPRVSVGTGWDLPIAGSWLIGSQIVLDASSLGSLKNEEDTVARRVGLSTIRVAIHLRRS